MSSTVLGNPQAVSFGKSLRPASHQVPAPPGRRALSVLVDGILLALTGGIGSVLTLRGLLDESPVLVLSGAALTLAGIVGLVVAGVIAARTGMTPGRRLTGLTLVSVPSGMAPGVGAAWGRYLLAGFGNVVIAGFIVALIQILGNKGGERRTWYDSITQVMLVRSAVDDAAPVSGDNSEWDRRAGFPGYEHVPIFSAPPGVDQALWIDPAHDRAYAPPEPSYEADPPSPLVQGAGAVQVDTSAWAPDGLLVAPALVERETGREGPVSAFAPPPSGTPAQIAAFLGAAVVSPGALSPRPIAPEATPVRAVFTFETGVIEEVSGAGVVGRNPQPLSAGGATVKIADTTRTVSQSHLAFDIGAHGVVVTDLSSTNGSTVIDCDGVCRPLAPQTPVQAEYGSTVTVGEHRFVVTRGADATNPTPGQQP